MDRFRDRRDAGRRLAERVAHLKDEDPIVLALPRGGVPVGYEVATKLGTPLDVFLVRKLGVPHHQELAFGAIASGGARVNNRHVLENVGLSEHAIEQVVRKESAELARRETAYRTDRPAVDPDGRSVILVDDGIATGATMLVAIRALKGVAAKVVCAVPVAPAETVGDLSQEADEFIAVMTPTNMRAIGLWYEDFSQTSDAEVSELLEAGVS